MNPYMHALTTLFTMMRWGLLGEVNLSREAFIDRDPMLVTC